MDRLPGRLWRVFFACVLLTLGLGVAKVYIQKEHPPAFVQGKPWQFYEGFVSVDGHATMAAAFEKWYSGGDPGARQLRDLFANEMHPTAVAVPAAVGALDLIIRFIPTSFMLLSAAALLANAWLAGRIAARIAPNHCAVAVPLAAIAVVAHCLTIRTSAQLLLDPFCAAIASASVLLTIQWIESRAVSTALLLVLIQMFGIFTKVSYAPMLAVPAAAAFFIVAEGRVRSAAAAAALFGAVPAALWGAFLLWLTGSAGATRESEHLLGSWDFESRELLHFGLEMILLFQGFVFLLFMRPVFPPGAMRGPLLTLALVLAATWAFHLPAVPRLYLPVVAPMASVCAVKLCSGTLANRLPLLLGGYLLLNYACAVGGLFMGS